MARPLRFATQIARALDGTSGSDSGRAWIARARELEAAGYGTLAMPDHVVGPSWSPFAALGAVAAATSTLRVGTLVLDNDFRNPLLVARETATLDVISNGRVELGLGGGWLLRDYESLGMRFDRGRIRVERLAEALEVLRRLFTEDEVSYSGRFYRLEKATCLPKCVQRPLPILVAGGGPQILALAGRHADIVAIVPMVGPTGRISPDELSFEATREKIEVVREAAGPRFSEVELSIFLDVVLTNDREKALAELAQKAQMPAAAIAASTYRPIGTIDDVRKHIRRAVDELGITYFCIRGPHVDDVAPLVRELSGAAAVAH
jgi:probable F420-dependent oxidoreductase